MHNITKLCGIWYKDKYCFTIWVCKTDFSILYYTRFFTPLVYASTYAKLNVYGSTYAKLNFLYDDYKTSLV